MPFLPTLKALFPLPDTHFWDVTVSLHSRNKFPSLTFLVSDHWKLVFVAAVFSGWLLIACFLGVYELPFVVVRL